MTKPITTIPATLSPQTGEDVMLGNILIPASLIEWLSQASEDCREVYNIDPLVSMHYLGRRQLEEIQQMVMTLLTRGSEPIDMETVKDGMDALYHFKHFYDRIHASFEQYADRCLDDDKIFE